MKKKHIIGITIGAIVLLSSGLLLWKKAHRISPLKPASEPIEKTVPQIQETKSPKKTPPVVPPSRVPLSLDEKIAVQTTLDTPSKKELLTLVLGEQEEKSYPRYSQALSALGPLTQPQRELFYDFLQSRQLPEGLQSHHLHALKNEMLNRLREQTSPPAKLTQTMIDLFLDQEQDPVIREYTLQHLSLWYEKATVKEKERCRDVFWGALQEERETNIAGTALIALYHLQPSETAIDRAHLEEAARNLAQDDACSRASRLTALQICGQLGLKEIIPLAMDLAEPLDQPLTLRAAAIASLGDLGDPAAYAFLQERMNDENKIIRRAASSALSRLKQKEIKNE